MQPTISIDSIVVAVKEQVSCDLEDEAAILHLTKGVYYGLNPVGARIWEMIQTPQKVTDVRDAILDEYEVEPGQCEHDLLALLADLADQGLIEVTNEAGA